MEYEDWEGACYGGVCSGEFGYPKTMVEWLLIGIGKELSGIRKALEEKKKENRVGGE